MLSRLRRTLPLSVALLAEFYRLLPLLPHTSYFYFSLPCGLSEHTVLPVIEAQLRLPTLPSSTPTFPEGQVKLLGQSGKGQSLV